MIQFPFRAASVDRIMLLAVTAAPGVQRLVFIWAISIAYTQAEVGSAAADLGVASFLALLAGGAVSGQIMALWARYPDQKSRNVLVRQSAYWQLGALLLAAVATWALKGLDLIESATSVMLFFAGFSVWQVERTKMLSDRRLRSLAWLEAVLASLMVLGALWPSSAQLALAFYGLSLLSTGGAAIIVSKQAHRVETRSLGDASCELGYRATGTLAVNGMVSTGREQLTIPAIKLIADASLAGVVAQVSTVIAALLLLPRSLSNHYVPSLSRAAGLGEAAESIMKSYRRSMSRALLAISGAFISAIFVLLIAGVFVEHLPIALLAGLSLIAGQVALLPSTVLTVRQAVAPILASSCVATVAWVTVVAALGAIDIPAKNSVMLLLGISTVVALVRALYLRRVVAGRIGSTAHEIAGDNFA